jgi:hypothetical protein
MELYQELRENLERLYWDEGIQKRLQKIMLIMTLLKKMI